MKLARPTMTPMKWFVLLTVLAIGLALGLPPDPQALHHLHTTSGLYRLAVAALLVPYIIIWYAGFYAFAKLREYSRPLKNTKDGIAFHKITTGMGMLAFSLVVPTIISLIITNIAVHHASFKVAAVIINNYLELLPAMLAFLLLYNGAGMLKNTLRNKPKKLDVRWHAPWFFLLGITFSHLTIENQYTHHSYHLSVWLLVVTYIVPYLYSWLVGLLSVHEFRTYAKTVHGTLYKRGVQQFANGIAIAIVGSIAIQFVTITISQRLSQSLGAVLLIDYGLLIIIATGLLLMALGTKKLKKIEEL